MLHQYKGTDGYEWQKKVKQILVERGVQFPALHPYYTRSVWFPIRQRWHESAQGQPFKTRLEALGRYPEGFGEKWRTLFEAEDAAFKTWMAKNNIVAPE